MHEQDPRTAARRSIDIVLATGNKDKVRELRPVLETIDPAIRVWSLVDLGLDPEIDETEPTLEGNARLKAQAIFSLVESRFEWLIALADDTGLEVTALDGAPGVRSARFAPVPAGSTPTYADNVSHLLRLMSGKSDRSARFRTVIAMKGRLPSPDGTITKIDETADGSIEGTITSQPYGNGGFGYDPLFMPSGMEKTFAEIGLEEKNAISHRGRAIQAAVQRIRELLASHCNSVTDSITSP